MRLGAACLLAALLAAFAAKQGAAAQPGTATVAGETAAGETAAGETAAGDMDPQAVATFRCTQLADPLACMAALSRKPHDQGLLLAEADALLRRSRPGEAIGVYRQALRAGADPQSTAARIAEAESSRRSLLRDCASGSDGAAISACEAAWLPGAPDEVALFKRRGHLLRVAERPAEALQAYVAAARLAPRDRNAARAVVELTAAPGIDEPAVLIARGDALMALGRPADAVAPLHRALQAAPDRRDVKSRLQMAEHGAALAAQPRVPTRQPPAPQPPVPQAPALQQPAPPQPAPPQPAVAKSNAAPLPRLAAPGNEAPLTRSN